MWNKVIIFLACVLIYFYKKSVKSERTSFSYYYKFFLYYFTIFIVTGFSWPLFLIRSRNVENIKTVLPIARALSRGMSLSWEIRNGKVLSANRGAVIVANHQSSLDVMGLFQIWDTADKMSCIAKKELFYLWPFGLTAYLIGTVFVDRRNPKEAYKELYSMSEVMTRDKTKILIFPEGTRNKGPEFLPFKKGAFNLAVASQVPIIPVVLSPYHFVDFEKRIFDEGHVIVQCLEEVPTKGLTQKDVPALIDNIREKMSATFKQLRKEVLADSPTKYTSIR